MKSIVSAGYVGICLYPLTKVNDLKDLSGQELAEAKKRKDQGEGFQSGR